MRPEYALLKSIPGIGEVLAIVIMLETGDIGRFAEVGNFASYVRCVDSARYSNGKKKGEGNTKNGNAYLCGLSSKPLTPPGVSVDCCTPGRLPGEPVGDWTLK